MLKKTIKFQDLDGNEVSEDFYFNMSKAELAEMELSTEGGMSSLLDRITKANDGAQIIALFKDILGKSVGRRSEDGRRFIKNDDIRDEFLQSDAYSELFMELITKTDSAAEFVKGLLPAGMQEKIDSGETAAMTELPSATASTPEPAKDDKVPAWIAEGRVPTEKELVGASAEQLQVAFRRKAKLTDTPNS